MDHQQHVQQTAASPSSKNGKEPAAADPSQGRQLLLYALSASRQAEFTSFYKDKVMPWLQERDIKARSWIAGNHLFALVSPNNQTWLGAKGIRGLEDFVEGEYLTAMELPNLE